MSSSRRILMLVASAAALLPFAALAADIGSEITNAETHATLAAQGTDVATVHMHLHHTLNCLVGPAGTGFDAKELNPCQNNGNGAIPDTTDASKKAALQSAASEASAGIATSDFAAAQKDATDTAAMLKKLM